MATAVNPQTGERIAWNGTEWVPASQAMPTAVNPQTGERLVYDGGQWRPAAAERGYLDMMLDAGKRGMLSNGQALVTDVAAAGGIDPGQAGEYIAWAQQEINRLPVPQSVQRFFGTETWGDAAIEFARSPLEITSTLVAQSLGTSLPSMVGGAVGAGLGAITPVPGGAVVGGAIGLGAGSAATETGAKILESFAEHGVDLSDPQQVAGAFANDELMQAVRGDAVKRGVTIGVFDAVSGAIAGRLVAGARSIGSAAARGVGEVGIQAGLGMAGEAAGSAVIGDPISPPDILAEGIGEIGTGSVEVAAGTAMRGLGAAGRARRGDEPTIARPRPAGEDPYFTDEIVPPVEPDADIGATPPDAPPAQASDAMRALPAPETAYGEGFTARPAAPQAIPRPPAGAAQRKPAPLPQGAPADPIQRAAHAVGQLPAGQPISRALIQQASGMTGNMQIRALLRALEGAGYAQQQQGRYVATGRASPASGGTGGMGQPGPTTEAPPQAPQPIGTQPEKPLPEFVPPAAEMPAPGTRVRVLGQDGSEFGVATVAGYTGGERPRVRFAEGGVGPVKQPFADLVRMVPVDEMPQPGGLDPAAEQAAAAPAGYLSPDQAPPSAAMGPDGPPMDPAGTTQLTAEPQPDQQAAPEQAPAPKPESTGIAAPVSRGTAPSRRAPVPLFQFIRDQGGIDPADPLIGDVRAILDKQTFQLLRRPTAARTGIGGRRLDDLRGAAVQAGYLREGATIADLIDAIREDAFRQQEAQTRVYRDEDMTDVVEREQAEVRRREEERALARFPSIDVAEAYINSVRDTENAIEEAYRRLDEIEADIARQTREVLNAEWSPEERPDDADIPFEWIAQGEGQPVAGRGEEAAGAGEAGAEPGGRPQADGTRRDAGDGGGQAGGTGEPGEVGERRPWRIEPTGSSDPQARYRVVRNDGSDRRDVWGYYATREQAESARDYAAKRAPASEGVATEQTDQGEQILVPGIKPVTDKDRAEAKGEKPLRSDKPQKPADDGLFDVGARGQGDLLSAPAPGLPRPATYGANNTLVTSDRAAELRKRLKDKLKNQLSAGIDPEIIAIGAELAVFHIEAGARSFADFARAIAADLDTTPDRLRQYLRSWYNGARDMMEDSGVDVSGMDTPEQVRAALDEITRDPAPAPQPPKEPAPPAGDDRARIAEAFRDAFAGGRRFASIVEARKLASDILGRAVDAGMAKMVEEAIEAGIVMRARDIVRTGRSAGRPFAAVYDDLVSLYAAQPLLNTRTSTSVEQQAYSTPAPLAYLASRLANVGPGLTVYEPTAGNGMLLIDATPAQVTANELNPDRFASLRRILGDAATVANEDATSYAPRGKVDRVVTNPPFGKTKNPDRSTRLFPVDGMMTPEIDHAIAWKALEALKDDGRAVLIIGGIPGDEATRKQGYRAAKRLAFMKKLYDNLNVTEHFTVDGALYERQGAGWPVDVIVIEGRGKSAKPLPSAVPPQIFGSWSELRGRLDGTVDSLDTRGKPPRRGDRPAAAEKDPADVGGVSSRPGEQDRPSGGQGATGARPGASGGGGGRRPPVGAGRPGGSGRADGGERGNADADVGGEPVDVPGADRPTADRPGDRRGTGGRDTGGVSGGGLPRPGRVERENLEAETAFQVKYTPASNARFAVGTLVPRNMQQAMTRALDALSGRVGDIDAYVAEKLGYPLDQLLGTEDRPGYFSAEQVDALALAIDNVEGGGGFVIGDQTGVGKGRFVAAMLRYALHQGKTPVFMTKDPGLYADMVRDLRDIGMKDIASRILVTNNGLRGEKAIPLSAEDATDTLQSLPDARQKAAVAHIARTGSLPDGYEMLFTTYSQVQYGPKGTEIDRQRAIMSIAPNAIMVLDESHEAGGTEASLFDKDTGAPVPNRAQFVRGALREAAGAVYSSATYAKNPTVMSLYFKTDLSLAVDNLDDLADTITAGGVPLQQVMANMLVEAGQYARRERSFEGVEMALDVLPTDERMAEQASTALRSVFNLDKDFMEAARRNFIDEMEAEGTKGGKDSAIGDSSASSTNFASIMHVVVSQMLLSLKAKAAVDKAIELHRQGQKPIIALSNTNESIARDYIDDASLRPGDPADLTFNAILARYLRRLRRITIKHADDTKSHVFLSDSDIRSYGGDDALEQYRRIEKFIKTIDLTGLPASPIDYILDRLNEAGVRADEITGRQDTLRGGKYTVRKGSTAEKKRAMNDYNSGKLDALVINKSGSTGFSLHATGKAGNDGKKRHMIVLQPDPNIDVFMQMLGRIHRTGQIKLPGYTIGVSDLAVEKRLAAVLMRKMASLNANTTASKKSAVSLDNVTDFMNKYGDEVVADFLRENADVANMTDVHVPASGDAKEGLAAKLTGRLAIMPPDRVADIYDQIESAYREYIEALDRMGLNSLEAKTLDLDARTVDEDVLVQAKGGGSPFAESANIEVVDVRKLGKPYTLDELQEEVDKSLGGDTVSAYVAAVQDKLDRATPGYIEGLSEGLRSAEKALEEAKSDSQMDRAKRRIASWQSAIAAAETAVATLKGRIAEYGPGSMHSLTVRDGEAESSVFAVVLGIDAKIKANPTAASAIRIRFAISDAGREVRVPLSKMIGDEPGYTTAPAMEDVVRRAFESGGQEAREKRQIITGNLVAGFGVFKKGQIVMFTDAEGRVRQGILMPKEFDAGKELEQRPVAFADPKHVTAFLQGGPDERWVHTSDKVMSIQFDGRTYLLQVNVRGGKPYYLNKQVRALVGDFQQRRGQKTQRAETTDPRKVEKAIEIYQENLGAQFVTTSSKDEARAITGEKPFGGEASLDIADTRARADTFTDAVYGEPTADGEKARAAVEKLLARIAPGAGVRTPDRLLDTKTGRDRAYGLYLDGVIHVALAGPSAQRTARHEAIHYLRQSGYIGDVNWRALEQAAKDQDWIGRFRIRQKYARQGLTEAQMVEEAVAEAYAEWAAGGREAKGRVAAAFRWMKRLFDQARAAIRRAVGRDADFRDLFSDIETGRTGASVAEGRTTGSRFADMLLRGASRLLPAWHGSPHDFDRFSLSKIGTGEGAQAFGWGMYFSSRKAIAEHYRRMLAGDPRLLVLTEDDYYTVLQDPDLPSEVHGSLENTREFGDGPITWETVIEAMHSYGHDGDEYVNQLQERWRFDVPFLQAGRLYEVNLTPKPEHLLDWDKPLSEQSEYVRERLQRIEIGPDFDPSEGRDIYEWLGEIRGGDRAASLALLEAGIPGIRYLDAGSRMDGEGTHNYVIFDEAAVEVRAKYEIADAYAEANPGRDITGDAQAAREDRAGFMRRMIGRIDKFMNPIEGLPEIRSYLAERYRTFGTIARIQDTAGHLTKPFEKASEADAEAVYAYLTTAEASPDSIRDREVRDAAVEAKRAVDRIGRQLVAKGLLREAAYERHKDAYLPRVYLRHLLEKQGVSGAATVTAGGKKVSDLGYLKQRKDIPEDVRRYILGQILDPKYLTTRALVKPARDIALLDFLDHVAKNERWIIPQSVTTWNGQRVTAAWLKNEAAALRRMTDHQPAEDAAVTTEIAKHMEASAETALREFGLQNVDISDYRQVPDAPRYGRMRGLWVRQEIHEDLVGSTQWVTGDGGNFAQRLLGQGGTLTKATQIWKLGKVALNPPTQVRNAISNAIMLHLSGVNGMMVIPRLVEAVQQMRSRGEYWQVAQRYGITEATFAHNELFRLEGELKEAMERSGSPLTRVAHLFGRIGNAAGDLYQATESAFKIAKIIDEMRKGRSAETAALEAQKWLFDYSLVSGTTQYLRNAPLGVPFITYYTKVMPRLLEVAATAPWRLAPYFTIPIAMSAWVASEWDVDDDDLDKLRMALPTWLRNRGTGVVPLPYKDANGNWQFADLSYFFPWAMFEGLGRSAAKGDVTEFLSQAGILGGPVPQVISAIQTGIDPFSGRPIVDEYDRPAKKLASLLNFAWSLAMPPWMTEYGFANRLWQATQGTVDPRTGKPRYTEGQAALRALGINVYPIDPTASRAANLRRMQFEINEVKSRMRRELKDPNLTAEQRQDIAGDYREMLAARAEQMREYAVDSQVNPKLLRAAP